MKENFSGRQNARESIMADKLDQRKLQPKASNRKGLTQRWRFFFQPDEELKRFKGWS